MDDVYIVEAAFTGPKGFPMDRVIEVSVCRMFADGSDFDTVYDSFVYAEPMDLGKDSLDFIQDNYGIPAEALYLAPKEDIVSKELLDILRNKECTSFNVNRTFGQFLCYEPWDLTGELSLFVSISSRLPDDISKSVKDAYGKMYPDNDMGVECTTSLDNCIMSTAVMMKLRQNGLF